MKKQPAKSAGDASQAGDGSPKTRRIMGLVEAMMRDPFGGIGKPEPLKYLQANTWSRRITDEHRLVYVVDTDRVLLKSARYHYEK